MIVLSQKYHHIALLKIVNKIWFCCSSFRIAKALSRSNHYTVKARSSGFGISCSISGFVWTLTGSHCVVTFHWHFLQEFPFSVNRWYVYSTQVDSLGEFLQTPDVLDWTESIYFAGMWYLKKIKIKIKKRKVQGPYNFNNRNWMSWKLALILALNQLQVTKPSSCLELCRTGSLSVRDIFDPGKWCWDNPVSFWRHMIIL